MMMNFDSEVIKVQCLRILFLLSQLGRCLEENVEAETGTVKNVPVVCEFLDVFLEELPRLPPEGEIEFCTDVVTGMNPISMPPYRMAPAELNDLNEQLK